MPYSPTPSGRCRSPDRSPSSQQNLALMRMMHNHPNYVARNIGTNQLFHVGWLQATFHLEALARSWRTAFCWLFHCSRRRRWVGRHVAWRSLTPPRLDLVDDGCGVAWRPFAAHAQFLCLLRLTCKGIPGSMPRGERDETSTARSAQRGIQVVGTWPAMFKQRPGSLHPPCCAQDSRARR